MNILIPQASSMDMKVRSAVSFLWNSRWQVCHYRHIYIHIFYTYDVYFYILNVHIISISYPT